MWVEELKIHQNFIVPIYCDNKGAIDLSKYPVYNCRTKHIDVKHYLIKPKKVESLKVCTQNMLADLLIKPVSIQKHEWCRI